MSYASFLADAEAVRARGDWLVILTLTDPSGSPFTLRYSRRGTVTGTAVTVGSTTISAHTAFRKRVIKAPSIQQSMWRPGALFSRSLPSYGEIVIKNTDGELDQYRPVKGYQWGNARCQVFFGDPYDLQNTIGLVCDVKVGVPKFSFSDVVIPLLGREADFNVPISTRVYRGTGYQLEMFGDRTAAFGGPAGPNVISDMTLEGWVWLEALPSVAVGWWGWFFGALAPWRVILDSTGKLRLDAHVGGVMEQRLTTAAMGTLKPYHFAFVVSSGAITYYLWDDDAQTESTETLTSFSSATRNGNSGCTYNLRTGSNATFKPLTDEFRVWNVARTAAEIRANRFREIPSSSIPASLVHYIRFNDGAGTTVTDSSAGAANGTISGAGTSQWLWAMEGGTELSGTPKPDVWGKKFGVSPVLVSSIHKVYQVAGRGSVRSIASYEGGNPHTMNAGFASMSALMTTTPGSGSTPYLARGYFRLAANPTLAIAALVEGYDGGSLGYVSAAGTISRDIITRRGPKLADPGGLDTSSFTAYSSASPAEMGIALYTPNTEAEYISQVLDRVNLGGAGWWGFVGSSILFHVERFTGPSVTADYNLSTAIVDIQEVYPAPPVIYEVVVRYRKNDVVLTEDQIAGALWGTSGWAQWTRPWQESKVTDATLQSQYAGEAGQSLVLETGLYNEADAQALSVALLSLLKGVKEAFTVTVRALGLQIEVGMTVTLTFQYQDGRRRFDLDGTRKYLVVGTETTLQEGKIVLTVWG